MPETRKENNVSVTQRGREKWWSELTDSERIERLRETVRTTAETVSCLYGKIDDLMRHVHGPNGDVLGSLRYNYGTVSSGARRPGPGGDDVYL